MLDLRHVLATGPRRLTPERAALAAIAALTAAATPSVVAGIPDAANEVGNSRAAMVVVVAITATLTAALGIFTLQARSHLRARLWLAFGAAGGGALAVTLSYAGVVLVRGGPVARDLLEVITSSIIAGGPIGFLFGTGFAPVMLAARRARETPSHDGIDRVVFAGGASLLVLGLLLHLLQSSLPGASLGTVAAAGGALAVTFAGARLLARIRLVARAREGGEPGLHVVPLSGREDEVPLLPLVRTAVPSTGVLAATGVSAPYRGARGIFKLGLLPLPGERFPHPVTDLIGAAVVEGCHVLLTLVLGGAALMAISPILIILVFARGFG